MPSKIAKHEDASSLGKEPLNIAGSTSSIGKWNKLIILIGWYSSNEVSGSVFLKRWPTWILRGKNFKVLACNNDIKKTFTLSNPAFRITRYYGHFLLSLGKALTFSLNSLNTRTPVNADNGHLFLPQSIDSYDT